MTRYLPLLALAAALASLTGCGSDTITSLGEVVEPGAAADYNVIVLTIDTARRDRYGCYGDEDAITPNLDRLAAEGVLVDDAVTAVPLTLPSHTTLLTGLDPPRHGVHDNGIDALGPGPSVLAGSLREAGYTTAAFVGAFVVDARFGLDRGFDVYDFQVGRTGYRPNQADFNERSASEVTDATLAWLDDRPRDRPFFVWMHYFDPHLPYTSPLATWPALKNRPYDAEITFADQQLGRLIAWLENRGLAERTIVIVTADHGEALGEHGELTHGMFIYDATMRVPLVIWSPSLLTGPLRLEDRAVGLVDLRATIEDLVGIGAAPDLDGLSLLGDLPADRRLYLETEGPLRTVGSSPLRGLRATTDKYIDAPDREYYDLVADPGETDNLYHEHRRELTGRQETIDAILATDRPAAAGRQLTDEEKTRLRSLGYTVVDRDPEDRTLPDPKRMIGPFNRGQEAERLYAAGDHAGAARVARDVLDVCPGCSSVLRVLAFSLLRMGHADSAVAILRDNADAGSDTYLLRSLAKAQILGDELDDALTTLNIYAELAPADGRVEVLRGDIASRRGDLDAALAHYERARAIDPGRVGRRADERIAATRERMGGG